MRRLGIDTSRGTRLRLVAARRRGYASTDEMFARVVELYGEGLSMRRVARETSLTAECVHKILRRHGIHLRP